MLDAQINPRILLIGNPNAGKTSLFNRLTGLRAHVANYPGVTVDFQEGNLELPSGQNVDVIDLPGTYSLLPCSEDEELSVKAVLGKLAFKASQEITVVVLNATQLKRNLYLLTQILELRRPIIVVLTMVDLMKSQGVAIDTLLLAQRLKVPVVCVSALSKSGVNDLRETIANELAKFKKDQTLQQGSFDSTATAESIKQRYAHIDDLLDGVVVNSPKTAEKRFCLDDILLHKFWGLFFLFFIFAFVFEALFVGATPLMDGIDQSVSFVAESLRPLFPEQSLFGSLLVDGIIAGVGSVIIFVPLIAILFFFIGLLEDSGYLARATFLLDRFMSKVGLSGRAFVPLLSGFACAVPAIMATRVIESKKDRLIAIMVLPLMSCSARLPVYGLLIAAVFATSAPVFGFFEVGALVMLSMYVLGIVSALLVAFLLRKTLFKGAVQSLILEFPPYRMPRWGSLLQNVWSRVKVFLHEAGTIILAMTIVIWGMFTFPRYEPPANMTDNHQIAMHQLENSFAGKIGQAIEPALAPLGFDWKISVGILSSFAAREVFVSTLGVMYGLGHDQESSGNSLKAALQNDVDPLTGKSVYRPLVALSLMVFFALAMQCMSTLAVTKRETKSIRWPLFQFGYMTALAWLCSFVVFQTGSFLGF